MNSQPVRFDSIDAYIATFAPATQTKLAELRAIIYAAAPEAVEKIAYGMPTFYLKGNLVLFAAWKKHIGFYGTSDAIQRALSAELAPYANAKGSLLFPLDQPLPQGLIRQIVELRVREQLSPAADATSRRA